MMQLKTLAGRGLARHLSFMAVLILVSTPAAALNVLVTNDDGWDSNGAQAIKDALLAAGHAVVLSAPAGEQSGSSAALNFSGLTITKEREVDGVMEFSVDSDADEEGAEPATSALVGISIAEEVFGGPPDLVVSGINAGANIGAFAQISGTVGATITSLANNLGGAQVQGIGISTDEPCDPEDAPDPVACEAEILDHYNNVAAFVVHVIDRLEARASGGRLLPRDTSLNINYPPLPPSEVLGVKVTRQGRKASFGGAFIDLTFGCFGSCASLPEGGSLPGGLSGFEPDPDQTDVRGSDAALYNEGFIVIVPIEADYTATPRNFRKTWRRLRGIQPKAD